MPEEPALNRNFSILLSDFKKRARLIDWITHHTTGKYYVGRLGVYFFDEQDAMAFKLYDVAKRLKLGELLT